MNSQIKFEHVLRHQCEIALYNVAHAEAALEQLRLALEANKTGVRVAPDISRLQAAHGNLMRELIDIVHVQAKMSGYDVAIADMKDDNSKAKTP